MSENRQPASSCPDCDATPSAEPISRRELIRKGSGAALLSAVASAALFELVVHPPRAFAAPAEASGSAGAGAASASSETMVAQLFKSLDEEQKKILCFPFDHQLRSQVNNNWFIIKKSIEDALKPDQQDMVKQIFMGLHSPEYAKTVFDQVEHDGRGPGSFKDCAIALFGNPGDTGDGGKSNFEFVLTGRHCTRRCDGNSVAGAAFGGPIFYGHAGESFNEKPDHKGNVYWYQAKRANEVFQALDGKQRKIALLDMPRKEEATKTVELKGTAQGLAGIPMTELSKDQQGLVRKVLDDLLAPFRKDDVTEAMKFVEAGGFDNLHLSFYNGEKMDIGNDGVWDVWQIEGPHMLWYFRGAPHVHTWVNIRDPKAKA
jgi:hypothetical protein